MVSILSLLLKRSLRVKRLKWMFYYLSFKYTQPMKLAKNRAGGGRIVTDWGWFGFKSRGLLGGFLQSSLRSIQFNKSSLTDWKRNINLSWCFPSLLLETGDQSSWLTVDPIVTIIFGLYFWKGRDIWRYIWYRSFFFTNSQFIITRVVRH